MLCLFVNSVLDIKHTDVLLWKLMDLQAWTDEHARHLWSDLDLESDLS